MGSVMTSTLPPKPPPTRAADEVQLVEGDLQDQGGIVQAEKEGLGVGINGVAAIRLRLGHTGRGFGGAVLDRAGAVPFFDNKVGLGKALLHVAVAHPAAVMPFVDKVIRPPIGDDRRAGFERLFHVEDGGAALPNPA